MQTMNERPVCHRSEDLVTYLYNEASAAEAQDFASHIETCEACRAEFAVFSQVHESILLWRNEALGAAFNPAAQVPVLTEATSDSTQFVRHERKLPALAALREFFSVSPLWLRGATAFAALLLCVLAGLTIARMSRRSTQIATVENPAKYSQQDVERARRQGVDEGIARISRKNAEENGRATANVSSQGRAKGVQLASDRVAPRPRGLTRQERVQLAADLRLTPGLDDEELPFGLLEQSNPDQPNQ